VSEGVEVVYFRHMQCAITNFETTEAALLFINTAEWNGDISSVGVYVDGEPKVWDGFCSQDPPTPDQADEMRRYYNEAS
jgi:hypothetical protein